MIISYFVLNVGKDFHLPLLVNIVMSAVINYKLLKLKFHENMFKM